MDDAPTLFDALRDDPGTDHAAVATDASDTSRDAALVAWPRTGTKRLAVLDAVANAGYEGRTDEELAAELRMGHNTERPRRRELVLGRWVVDSGRRRATASSGCDSTVWVLNPDRLDDWRNRPCPTT